MRPATLAVLLAAALPAVADWMQWGRTAAHNGASPVIAQSLYTVLGRVVLDPFADQSRAAGNGNLLVHYQAPLVHGDDVFLVIKSGTFTGLQSWNSQTWNVSNYRWTSGQLVHRWTTAVDWKPVPCCGPSWEPVYHVAVTSEAVWAPGAGGTMLRLSRADGSILSRVNPFGVQIDANIHSAGPPAVDAAGNVYYNAIQLNPASPWTTDPPNAWLVKIAAGGAATTAPFATLVPAAPAASAECTTQFPTTQLPFPPAPDAVAPSVRCGPQRPGMNVTPAIGPDGTIYTVSRAHTADRWGYLVAVNADLTPKWATSLRNRFMDGCNVVLPPNGTPGGCRTGAATGVDPTDNQPGSGRVTDDSTSSPVVLPDGRILYGAHSRYNYSAGHLMLFDADGTYRGAYGFGWDITPSVWQHDGTYSIIIKENRYGVGSYCGNSTHCPRNRSAVTPQNPESYYITQLSPSLNVEWQHQNRNTQSCERLPDGTIRCTEDHPNGFEWCVNALAVDARGMVYVNSEDGNLYALRQGGTIHEKIFLRIATGAAYTPLSIGSDGKVYTQNAGELFVVGTGPRRRVVRGR